MIAKLARHRAAIVARWLEGASMHDLAAEFDCGVSSISKRLHQWGVAIPPRRGQRPSTLARDLRIVALRRKGVSYAEICERFGLSPNVARVVVCRRRKLVP